MSSVARVAKAIARRGPYRYQTPKQAAQNAATQIVHAIIDCYLNRTLPTTLLRRTFAGGLLVKLTPNKAILPRPLAELSGRFANALGTTLANRIDGRRRPPAS